MIAFLTFAKSSSFLSTLSLRRATVALHDLIKHFFVSIHALLAESDRFAISAHRFDGRFLSTLSLRRATHTGSSWATLFEFLSTLSLRRATKVNCTRARISRFLSTLSLRRATKPVCSRPPLPEGFYPRSPCGERQVGTWEVEWDAGVSIHALLAESDMYPSQCRTLARGFYPRSPCGERRLAGKHITGAEIQFLSTLSLRRATQQKCGDREPHVSFYPRSPCGERPPRLSRVVPTPMFLSTLSLRRATRYCACPMPWAWRFYPRSPCGERPKL